MREISFLRIALFLLFLNPFYGLGQTAKHQMCDETFYSEQRTEMNFLLQNPNEMDSLVLKAAKISPTINTTIEKMNAIGEEIKQSKKVLLNAWSLSAGTGIDFVQTMDNQNGQRLFLGVNISPKKLFLSGSEKRRLEHVQKSMFHVKEEYKNQLEKLLYEILFERLKLLEEMALNHDFFDDSEQYYNLLKKDFATGDIGYKEFRYAEINYSNAKLDYIKSEYDYNLKTIEFNQLTGK